ncbi:MAG: hypothetical protein IT307_01210 [Chloroflexi bacterium]|nr:hypothetical protein [Chloroflexota bacterium]
MTLLAGWHDLALGEYARAIEQAHATNPLRCRGLVDVARHDLRVTRGIRPELRGVSTGRDALKLLEQTCKQADGAAAALPPMPSV